MSIENLQKIQDKSRLKIRSFVESNRDYYAYMAKLFPEEDIWKKALMDTEELLKGESE